IDTTNTAISTLSLHDALPICTIGKIVTKAERGNSGADERPQFPCVGTNAMNFANVNRATQGLVAYAKEWHTQNKIAARPKIVIRSEEHTSELQSLAYLVCRLL